MSSIITINPDEDNYNLFESENGENKICKIPLPFETLIKNLDFKNEKIND